MKAEGVFIECHSDNPNLHRALQLRKQGDYPQAAACLKSACDENDAEALYHMGVALWEGGFGVKMNREEGEVYLRKAERIGSKWAHVYLDVFVLSHTCTCEFDGDDDPLILGFKLYQGEIDNDTKHRECFDYLFESCKRGNTLAADLVSILCHRDETLGNCNEFIVKFGEEGDAKCLNQDTSFVALEMAANQFHLDACENIFYRYHLLVAADANNMIVSYAKSLILMYTASENEKGKPDRLFCLIDRQMKPFNTAKTDLHHAYYLLGQYFFDKHFNATKVRKAFLLKPIAVYNAVTEMVKEAVYYWLLISTRFFYRDVRNKIAKLLFETRYEDAYLWWNKKEEKKRSRRKPVKRMKNHL
jgi:TPR repeat protein